MTAVAAARRAGDGASGASERRGRGRRSSARHWSLAPHLVLAAVSYLPLLLTQRGQVVADTKQYLYLDPAGVLAGSRSLWDPDWALGTVTHQSIGYLWPMGPWYRLFDLLGAPVWVAQRLWVGTILFAAGAGIVFLGRVFGWSRRAALVAALVYVLSPYPLAYATRISALILPWGGLPWLVGLGVRSLRRGGWRDPALLALVATTVGAVNASSLLYAGLAVVLWFPFAAFVHREATVGRAVAAMARIGVLVVALSLWWAVPLVVQGRYGADVLRFSETLEVVASGSPSTEAWRGLGYWIFYGGDRTGPWVSAGEVYTERPLVLAATFGSAVVSLAVLFAFRWRYRAYVLALAVAGIALTVGLYPYDEPGTVAGLLRDRAAGSTVGLALRSSPRALPLYLLAVACAVAVAYDALARLRPRLAPVAAAGLVLLAAAGLPPLWTGQYLGDELARAEELPAAWDRAAAWLDGTDPNERALIVPGSDFSAHRWGNTIDHVLPGLTDRPVAVRELVAFSTAPAADLLIALDRRFQERVLVPDQVGPVARLLGAGAVVLQSDLEFERYRTPRPVELWSLLSGQPTGLGEPIPFGPPYANRPSDRWPMVDEVALALDPALPDPPQVAALPVVDPLGVVRAHPAQRPVVVAGDGESLVSMAGAGLLPDDAVVLYEAALSDAQLADAVARGGEVVLTDGNRARARRWKTIRDNVGLTENPDGDGLRPDPTDARLEVFDDAPAEAATVTEQRGVRAGASAYGNPISYHPEDRAFAAVDGDPTTAWRVGAFSDARGEHLELSWDDPVPTSTVTLLQPVTGSRDRTITDLRVSVDGGPGRVVRLDERSLTEPGQVLDLGLDQVSSLRLEIVETSAGDRPGFGGLSAVGLAEVSLDGAPPTAEVVVLPRSVAQRIDELPDANPLTVVVERQRVDAASAVREDPERAIVRSVDLPDQRAFTVSGTARLSGRAPSAAVDDALGLAAAPRAQGSDRMPGAAAGRASAALDGDPATAWRTPFGAVNGQSLTVDLGGMRTVDQLAVTVVADGRHSVPTALGIASDTGDGRFVELEPVADGPASSLATFDVSFDELEASSITLSLESVREESTIDWYSGALIDLPVGVAEVSIPGMAPAVPAATLPDGCRDDLLTVDGSPVPVRLRGDTATALADRGVEVEGCGPPITLGPGPVLIETAVGRHVGIDVDQLVLRAPGAPPAEDAGRPAVEVTWPDRDRATVTVDGDGDDAYWLVLGQGFSSGWEATVVDGPSLGPPTLVDGFANGWLVDPTEVGAQPTIELRWAPNQAVHWAIVLSALAAVVSIALVLWPVRRRGVRPRPATPRLTGGPEPVLGPRAAVVASLATAVLGTAVTRPALGLAAAAVVLAAGWWRWATSTLAVVGVGALAAAGAYVTVQQVRYAPPHDGAWPSLWDPAHLGGWVALAALAGGAVVEVLVTRRRAGAAARPGSAEPPTASLP